MATVTGFTAERMLVIENETVVDGEVQGDNLVLITREGTPIDAGNVRGPKGDTGPAGGVTNVNDQVGAVYAPRIFATKAALDADWAAAPNGSMATTVNNNTVWVKIPTGWVVVNNVRSFPNKATLDSTWTDAPVGAHAWTVTEAKWWTRTASTWFDEELAQNNAIAALQSSDTSQNTAITNLQNSDASQNGRLGTLEGQMVSERYQVYTANVYTSSKMLVQCWMVVGTTDGNGNLWFNFPVAFGTVPRVTAQVDASFGAGWMMAVFNDQVTGTAAAINLCNQNGTTTPNQLIKFICTAIGTYP